MLKRNNKVSPAQRYGLLSLVVLLLAAAVICRLGWLQLVKAQELSQKAADKLTASGMQKNPRGKIVDRNGEELAVSIMTGTLYADPLAMEDPEEERKNKPGRDVRKLSADLLAPALQMDAAQLYKDFNEPLHFLYIKRAMEPREYEAVQKIIKDNKLPGLHFLRESKRYYTKQHAAAQVIGFVGTDDKGLSGIELQLDSVLQGKETKYKAFYDFGRQTYFRPRL